MAETLTTGSSAITPFLVAAMKLNCAGTVYRYSNNADGESVAYLCERAPSFTGVTQQYLLLHKREGGDAGNAIRAVQGGAQANAHVFIKNSTLANANSCATPVNSIANCSAPVATPITASDDGVRRSEANFSDVEPTQFLQPLNAALADLNVVTHVTVTPVVTHIYGVAVNTRLRNAMQSAQAAAGSLLLGCSVGDDSERCMPSLTSAQIGSLFVNLRLTDWRNLRYGGTATSQNLFQTVATSDQPSNRSIHLCLPVAGSGTLALFNTQFQNAPCNQTLSEAIQVSTTPALGIEPPATTTPAKVTHALDSTADIENCLEGLNNNTAVANFNTSGNPVTNGFRWAIGLLGIGQNPTGSKPYRFIKIDNASPSAHNVVEGRYKFWAELMTIGAVTDPLAQAMVSTITNPTTLANLNVAQTWGGTTGLLGLAINQAAPPTNTATVALGTLLNAAYDPARPVNPYTRATANGLSVNHCRIPSLPAGSRALPVFYPVN
ncbi:MAG: hypothetical protein WC757_00185 [Candidatus Paceibacterota bacterium]